MLNTTVAHYQISAKLGEGGMGEVYRARDTKLDREVAIKVLPKDFADHPERVARFEREAKSLAKLNHPNVAAIYGFDHDAGHHFLVLELVEGETLQERFARGAMPLEESLAVFQQIAAALEAAHERGIIHRDLKPANIKVDPNGCIKVLDFGLAKAVVGTVSPMGGGGGARSDLPDDEQPTIPDTVTQAGRVLGTAAYMSPEQSRGLEVDRRTDVWAFGCCLYEALTGNRPFKGQTASDLMAEILKTEPDFERLPRETPREVLTLLRRSLEKDPRKRLRDLGDIAITLEEVSETSRPWVSGNHETRASRRESMAGLVETFSGWRRLIVAIVMVASCSYAVWDLLFDPGGREAEVATGVIRSLAVLPFVNAKAGDQESQWLSKTLHEALKQQLKPVRRLTMKPTATRGVDATVQGTYVREGDQLHVTVSLQNHNQETEVPLGNYTHAVTDIFQLQNEIAIAVAEEIRSSLSDEERSLIAKERDIEPRAYIAYRRGFQLYFENDIEAAVRELDLAISLDASFVEPIVLLADAQWWPLTLAKTSTKPQEGYKRAREKLKEAISIAPEHSGVLWQQGILAMCDWDWSNAQTFLRKSYLNAPDNPDFHEGYAGYKMRIEGDVEEATDLIARALSFDSENVSLRGLEARIYYYAGDYQEALERWTRLSGRKSDYIHLMDLAVCHLELGQYPEAESVIEQAVMVSNKHPDTQLLRAELLARTGDTRAATSILERIEEERARIYVSPIKLAPAYVALGSVDRALQCLEEGFEERAGWRYTQLRSYRLLQMFQNQLRYWTLIDRMKFPALPVQHPFHEKEQQMRFRSTKGTKNTNM